MDQGEREKKEQEKERVRERVKMRGVRGRRKYKQN